jgi:TetR/AcrR family transcriptional regulator, regulator of cefoperazone and chloramphenicol sensitivity
MAVVPRHRHSVAGGYARGEETRARIITAALKLFGQQGFDGSSTRDIAQAAEVNAPALQYYFDNKEGVFIAVVETIVARVWDFVAPVVEHAERLVADGADDTALIEAFCDIQAKLAEFMFTAQDAEDWSLFMARLHAGEGPPGGFKILYECMAKRISSVTSTIVGLLIGRPAEDEETVIRTVSLTGQVTVFQARKRGVMMKLNWDRVDAHRLSMLQRVVREQTEIVLRSMVGMREAEAGSRPKKARKQRA